MSVVEDYYYNLKFGMCTDALHMYNLKIWNVQKIKV